MLRRVTGSWLGRAAIATVGVVGLLVGVTAVSGGLDAAPQTGPPVVAVGDPVELGRVRLTVLDAAVSDQVEPALLEATEGAQAWLVVRVRIEVSGTESLGFLPDLLTLPAGIAMTSDPPRTLLVRDAASGVQLHPGLPEEVAYLWPVARAADVPDLVELELLGSTQYLSPAWETLMWHSPTAAAHVRVPSSAQASAALVESAPVETVP